MKKITVIVDDTLYDEVAELYQELGIDLETAIKLFLKQSVFHNELPFRLKLPGNNFADENEPIIDDILT